MTQTWSELLFLHYALPEEAVRPLVPESLPIDTFEGKAWLSIASFRLSALRMRRLPPLPFGSEFLELNLRTYVTLENRPGVFFFSLDASSAFAVWGARTAFALPYFRAEMTMNTAGGEVQYSSRRRSREAQFQVKYHPVGEVRHAVRGELDYFLTERYCLYAVRRRRVYRTEIHHLPWPLQPAEAAVEGNTMLQAAGVSGVYSSAARPLASATRFVRRLDVLVWMPEQCG